MVSLTPKSLNHNSLDSQVFLHTFSQRLLSLTSSNNTSNNRSKRFLVAYSGGMDSHVLLQLMSDWMKQIDTEISVRAVHVHHGLQEEANSWPEHCQIICDKLKIPLEIVYLNLTLKSGESLEAVARQGRYQALEETLAQDEVLLTAHHQRDQAETFLLQLFRGAGVQGLASMPTVTSFAESKKCQHIRPLLSENYQSIKAYAKDNLLKYIEDPSNNDNSLERNFLRNQILPQLREHWQSIDKTISRSATIQSETKLLLDEFAEEIMQGVCESKQETLSINGLLGLSISKRKLLLRYWITQRGFKVPSEKKLNHIISDVLQAQEDAQPLVAWQGAEIRRFKNQIYCNTPLQEHDNKQILSWNTKKSLKIESLNLTLSPKILDDLHVQNHPVTVRFRQGGEKLYSPHKNHSQNLKKVLNEANIAPWLRDRIPLIYAGDKLIDIIGLQQK